VPEALVSSVAAHAQGSRRAVLEEGRMEFEERIVPPVMERMGPEEESLARALLFRRRI